MTRAKVYAQFSAQKYVSKTLVQAVKQVEGPQTDDLLQERSRKKQVKMTQWNLKAQAKVTETDEVTPKASWQESLKILRTRVDRKLMIRMPDGEIRMRDLTRSTK